MTSLRARMEVRKNRLRRRSQKILYEIYKVTLLMACVIIVSALLIFTYNFIVVSPYFQLRETVVKGAERIPREEILNLAEIKPDQNILTVNLKAMARRIQGNVWVKDVSIKRDLPSKLIIEVRERKPVALLKKDEAFYYIERDGVIFTKLGKDQRTDLPILTGFCRKGEDNRDRIRKSIDLLEYLSSYEEIPGLKNVSEIYDDRVFGLSLFTDSGMCLLLGFDDFERKLQRLKPILADLTRRETRGFLIIDLNNPHKVTVQGKELPTPVKKSKGVRA
ncbi:MAG: cell division protein [Deltaproteobacteria bacterium]|jgi:cell division protein FtsQ|nr:cell division protein [Deltaproteobacteria bacterium]